VERLGGESAIEQRQVGTQAIAVFEVVGNRFGIADALERCGANELAANLAQSILFELCKTWCAIRRMHPSVLGP